MFTYAKIICNIPDVFNNRADSSNIVMKEFVVKEHERLVKNDNRRVIGENIVVCDAIEVFRDRDEFIQVTAIVGKTRRVFHFNNVIWTEVDKSET